MPESDIAQPKSDWKKISLTPIKENDDGSNNYNEFRTKSILELDAAGYWKFIDGPEYIPPAIPELKYSTQVEGLNDQGEKVTIRIPGNEILVNALKEEAKEWLDGDKKTLSFIVKAVPVQKLYVVQGCTTARSAWFALKNEYEPSNSLTAIAIKQQIIVNSCEDDDPVLWLRMMIQLYGRLRDADPSMMPDSEFAKHLVVLMSNQESWRYCRDDLRKQMREGEAAGRPMSSSQVIRQLKTEEIERGIAPSVASINAIVAVGKGKGKSNPIAYNINTESGRPSSSKQQQFKRNERKPKPYPSRKFDTNLVCDNQYCLFPVGHTKKDCYVYGGGKAGQYPANFRGQKDLHLSPEARAAARRKQNIERVKQGQVGIAEEEQASMASQKGGDPSRENGPYANYGEVTERDVEDVLTRVEDSFAFMMEIEREESDEVKSDEVVLVNATALNLDVPTNNSVNHDTGATRHIFRDRNLFHDYTELETPLNVHGFGSKLTAVATGKGTIVLKAKFGNSTRAFSLSNVLHIPSARCNLISGSRLDKKGVKTRTGDGKVTYYNSSNTAFALGTIVRDLYQMDVSPVQAPVSDPSNTSSTSSPSDSISMMVPDVTRLFGPNSESEVAKRVGFTTV